MNEWPQEEWHARVPKVMRETQISDTNDARVGASRGAFKSALELQCAAMSETRAFTITVFMEDPVLIQYWPTPMIRHDELRGGEDEEGDDDEELE